MDLRQSTDALVYNGAGEELLGLVDKVTFEGRKTTTIEHKTLGSVAMLEMPGRPLQAIKGKIEIGHLNDVYDRSLINPTIRHDWQLHKKIDVYDENGYSEEKSHTIVWHMKFHTTEDDGIDTELGEKDGVEYAISVPYLRIFRQDDATALWFLDAFNNTFEIDGQPVWKK